MQSAEIVLNIISEKSKNNEQLNRIYRHLYNPEFYLRAYQNLYANNGAMTKGATQETVDGMSLIKIEKIINKLRKEEYRWTPVRRTYISKKNGKLRPLGIPSWSDKLLQEVIRQILEAYYEPQFSEKVYGFRPNRGCQTALETIRKEWKSIKWFVEGDIENCFGSLDHSVLLNTLSEKIKDNRFLRLIENLLKSGYIEDWEYGKTMSGCPQGTIIGPILSNIYMNKLDQYLETGLIAQYTKGKQRKQTKEYNAIWKQLYQCKKIGDWKQYRELKKKQQSIPSKDPSDPNFRRLSYIRYADDWLIGLSGSKQEAEEIKEKIRAFLKDVLKLKLSDEKTLITHAKTQKSRFLGYDIHVLHENSKHDRRGQRIINAAIGLRIPDDKLKTKMQDYCKRGKPTQRAERTRNTDYDIISQFQAEFRGFAQYYLLAYNAYELHKLKWVMQESLIKTLADKYRSTKGKMYKKYRGRRKTENGELKVIQVKIDRKGKPPLVAYFGGIELRYQKEVKIEEIPPQIYTQRSQLVERLLKNTCELCGSQERVEMHHIRKLKDIVKKQNKPDWMRRMVAIKRKSLAVCLECHTKIHSGNHNGRRLTDC